MPPINPRSQRQQPKPQTPKKTSGSNNTTIGIIVAVVVLLGAGVAAYFFYPPFHDLFRKVPKEIVTEQPTAPKDTVTEQSTAPKDTIIEEAPPVEEPVPQKQEVSSSTPKGFYVIVGSFREQNNAEQMVKKCNKDIALQVIYFQEIGMHRVSAGHYDNIRKAYNDTYSIKDLDGCSGAWVLEVL